MKVFYGSKGSEFYIMCRDFNEVYAFDMFGTLSRVNGSIESCDNWQEVDYLSFVGIGNSNCELLFNNYKAELGVSLLDAIKPFRMGGKYLGTIFNVPHEDSDGRFTQVVFVYPKGTISYGDINNQFPNRYWNLVSSC